MLHLRSVLSVVLSILIGAPAIWSQAPQMYKLTIVDNAGTQKRVKKGRVSSQAVVKVTDQNDVPVAGIAVLFAIPQFSGGGAAFADGALTSTVTTNAAGVATSTPFTASAGSFNMGVTASTPGGGTLTGTVPVSITAAAAGAGVSTGVIVAIIVGVGAAAGAGIALGTRGGGGSSGTTTPGGPVAASPTGTISGPGGPSLNPPK